jgi:hypothetical protein
MLSLSSNRLIEILTARLDDREGTLNVFWYESDGDRDALCAEIEAQRGLAPIFPIVIRERAFDDPNALLPDLVRIIEKHRGLFEHSHLGTTKGAVGIILISRSPLVVAQLSSPVVLGQWFPRFGGQLINVRIEDLARSADGAINSEETAVQGIQEALYGIEVALVARLRTVPSTADTNKLFAAILGTEKPHEVRGFLERAHTRIQQVSAPRSYRSEANNDSISGRLIKLVDQRSPKELVGVAELLGRALAAPDPLLYRVDEAMFVVLVRSLKIIAKDDWGTRFSRNVLETIYAAHQLLNAASHAWEFPNYPIETLQSTSRDLRRTLVNLSTNLHAMNMTHGSA